MTMCYFLAAIWAVSLIVIRHMDLEHVAKCMPFLIIQASIYKEPLLVIHLLYVDSFSSDLVCHKLQHTMFWFIHGFLMLNDHRSILHWRKKKGKLNNYASLILWLVTRARFYSAYTYKIQRPLNKKFGNSEYLEPTSSVRAKLAS